MHVGQPVIPLQEGRRQPIAKIQRALLKEPRRRHSAGMTPRKLRRFCRLSFFSFQRRRVAAVAFQCTARLGLAVVKVQSCGQGVPAAPCWLNAVTCSAGLALCGASWQTGAVPFCTTATFVCARRASSCKKCRLPAWGPKPCLLWAVGEDGFFSTLLAVAVNSLAVVEREL